MPRGGRRTGTPGKAYSNRTDLNGPKPPMMVASGQQYGMRKQQMDAQRAMPVAAPPGPAVAPPAGAVGGASGPAMSPGPAPGQVVPLDAPTMRPGEPVTAGLPVGPGAGLEVNPFANVGSEDDAVLAIRAAYAAYPSEALRAVLERMDTAL